MKRSAVHPRALAPFSVLPRRLVDRLPQRWWASGNLYFLPLTQTGVHLCVGITKEGVRTIEVGGRTIAWGRAPFNYEASQRDAKWFDERFDRKHGLLSDDE